MAPGNPVSLCVVVTGAVQRPGYLRPPVRVGAPAGGARAKEGPDRLRGEPVSGGDHVALREDPLSGG